MLIRIISEVDKSGADTMEDIKDFIKRRREELGLTQKDIAAAVGVSEATVSRWESGDIGDMKRSRIAALARILQTSPNIIMGWKDEDDFKIGNLLSTEDDSLINIINNIVNLDSNKLELLKDIISDVIELDSSKLEQLKKFVILLKSNVLD